MIVLAALAMVAAAAIDIGLLWRVWDNVTGADLGFVLTPAVVALFIFGRWHDQRLPIVLGLILLLVSIYSAWRLYRGARQS